MARAQVAVETIVTIAFLLALLIPVVYVLHATLSARGWSIDAHHAYVAVSKLADSASKLSFGGEGARTVLSIFFPLSTTKLTAKGREITLSLDTELGRIDVVALAAVNVSFFGAAPRGARRVVLNYSGGVVWLTLE